MINLLPEGKFYTSKLKQFADDNFKFDENGRKLSKWVENTMGKGKVACYEQFLLFPQCFQKACFPGASKGVGVREWVKPHLDLTSLIHILFQDEVELRHVVKSLSGDSEKTSMDVEAFQRLLVTARSVAVARPGNLVKFAEKEASDNEKDGINFCGVF